MQEGSGGFEEMKGQKDFSTKNEGRAVQEEARPGSNGNY